MSDERQDTVEDIVAEMRDEAARADMEQYYTLDDAAESMREYAIRLEAAWKRQEQAHLDQIRDAMNMWGHEKYIAEHAQKPTVCNAAVMREALATLRKRFDNNTMAYQDRYFKFSGWHWRKKAAEAARWRDVFLELREMCDSALAAPARNCDLYPDRNEASKVFQETVLTERERERAKKYPLAVMDWFIDWLLAPATEKGADDGK